MRLGVERHCPGTGLGRNCRNDRELAWLRFAHDGDGAVAVGAVGQACPVVKRAAVRARLLEAQSDSALRTLDDAEEALRLVRDCGYAWGERDALFLQAAAYTALDRRDVARRVREDADVLAARLTLTEADLDDAEAKAKAWLAEWERSEPKTE
jgi:hypothetical protein